jgi:hypothetical protein
MIEDKTVEAFPWRYCDQRAEACDKRLMDLEKLLILRIDLVKSSLDFGFAAMEKALILARDAATDEKRSAECTLNAHLEKLNQHSTKMERLESTFATKEGVAKEFKFVNKVLYIGLGIFIAVEFFFKYLVK